MPSIKDSVKNTPPTRPGPNLQTSEGQCPAVLRTALVLNVWYKSIMESFHLALSAFTFYVFPTWECFWHSQGRQFSLKSYYLNRYCKLPNRRKLAKLSNLLRELLFQFVVFVITDMSWILIQENINLNIKLKYPKAKELFWKERSSKLPVGSDSSIIFDSSPKAYLSRRNISDDISKNWTWEMTFINKSRQTHSRCNVWLCLSLSTS